MEQYKRYEYTRIINLPWSDNSIGYLGIWLKQNIQDIMAYNYRVIISTYACF